METTGSAEPCTSNTGGLGDIVAPKSERSGEHSRIADDSFHAMTRQKALTELDPWIERGRDSLVGSFANGIARDIAAVRAAIATGWSNGQTEGQITKLKLVKRQMYGRGKLDLLEARLIGAP